MVDCVSRMTDPRIKLPSVSRWLRWYGRRISIKTWGPIDSTRSVFFGERVGACVDSSGCGIMSTSSPLSGQTRSLLEAQVLMPVGELGICAFETNVPQTCEIRCQTSTPATEGCWKLKFRCSWSMCESMLARQSQNFPPRESMCDSMLVRQSNLAF